MEVIALGQAKRAYVRLYPLPDSLPLETTDLALPLSLLLVMYPLYLAATSPRKSQAYVDLRHDPLYTLAALERMRSRIEAKVHLPSWGEC
jgi:hypothetical protein